MSLWVPIATPPPLTDTRWLVQVGTKLSIAVFWFATKNKVYAIDAVCPHSGGPLHLGDLEDLGGGDEAGIV
jgi:nitrite reductase/ring-hydroxylating ferredoxin subunit